MEKSLEDLEKKYSFSNKNLVGSGAFGKVFSLNEKENRISLVGKFLYGTSGIIKSNPLHISDLLDECQIQNGLFEVGIKVPKPFGIYSIKENISSEYNSGFVMRYLEGINLSDLYFDLGMSNSLFKKAKELFNSELTKVRDFGFLPDDCGAGNAIWVPEEEQTYLIDFGLWKRERE